VVNLSEPFPVPDRNEAAPDTVYDSGRIHAIVREAAQRFANSAGWKRHVPWFLGALGKAAGLSRAYLYKNYPDESETPTAVRIAGWTNPLHDSSGEITDPRISRYESPYFQVVQSAVSVGRSLCWHARLADARIAELVASASLSALVVVPIFAGDEWWGFLGAQIGRISTDSPEGFPVEVLENVLWTVATLIGGAARTAGVQQALRWSERLQRIQRDMAVTVSRGSVASEAIEELLSVICELGSFDSGAIELCWEDQHSPTAVHGSPPVDSMATWCESCRPDVVNATKNAKPVYVDAAQIEACTATCPIRASATHSYAVIPIVYENAVAGLLMLFSDQRSRVPAAVRRSIEAVATEIAMVISRVRADQLRRRSDERVLDLAKRLKLAVDAGQVAVWELDSENQTIRLDHSFGQMLGLASDTREIPIEHMLELMEPQYTKRVREAIALGAEPWPEDRALELRLAQKGGPAHWIAVRWQRLSSPGEPLRLIGTAVDVTGFKRVQEELTRAKREATESSAAKSEFLGKMSHEFRTPLNAILGSIQMMRRDSVGDESALALLERSAKHLLSMVENILDQSRMEAGRLQIQPEPVDLAAFLSAVSEHGRLLSQRRGLSFVLERISDLPLTVSFDSGRVRQVLDNLIANATKYTEKGGISLTVRWRNASLRFAVKDTGRGIPAEERDGVFLPFRHSGTGSGTGLGLAISNEITTLMGSRIWLATTEGRGSTFWFTIRTPALSEGRIMPYEDSVTAALLEDRLPSSELIDRLSHAVQMGDVNAVQQLVDEGRSRFPEAVAFLEHVANLAREFQIRALKDTLRHALSSIHEGS
jgi:PAS domain S-box-containing protein